MSQMNFEKRIELFRKEKRQKRWIIVLVSIIIQVVCAILLLLSYRSGQIGGFIAGVFSGWAVFVLMVVIIDLIFRKLHNHVIVCDVCDYVVQSRDFKNVLVSRTCPSCGISLEEKIDE